MGMRRSDRSYDARQMQNSREIVIFCLRKYTVASSIIRKHLDSRSGRRDDLEIAPLRQQMLAPDWDQGQVRFRGRHRIVEDALPSIAMNSIISGGPHTVPL